RIWHGAPKRELPQRGTGGWLRPGDRAHLGYRERHRARGRGRGRRGGGCIGGMVAGRSDRPSPDPRASQAAPRDQPEEQLARSTQEWVVGQFQEGNATRRATPTVATPRGTNNRRCESRS